MSKWYAVRKGRQTGLFQSWVQTQPYVNGFPEAEYKSFRRQVDAEQYLNNKVLFHQVEIYTDGSCIDQKGGVGVVVVVQGQVKRKLLLPVESPTTNNVCELLGLLHGCYTAKSFGPVGDIVIFTDSMYSLKAVTVWASKWEKNGWLTSKGKPVVNQNLIQKIRNIKRNVTIQHVYGHSGCQWNEMADQLANEARQMLDKC